MVESIQRWVTVQRFPDQAEAEVALMGWEDGLAEWAATQGPLSMESAIHRREHDGEGGSTTLYYVYAHLIGMATVCRDPMNWSVLMTVDLRDNP